MKILFYLIGFGLLFVLYVRFLENRMLFVPAREVLADPSRIGLDFEDVMFTTHDGLRLNGWLIKAPRAQSTLIFCHGNAGNIGDRLGKLEIFHEIGVNVLIFDYRGYGKSEGAPTEAGIYADAIAVYDYLKGRTDINAEKIIAYGASLGGAVAIDLSTQRELAALIIDSSFTNGADMAKRIVPFVPSFIIGTKLDSLHKVGRIKTPKLFFHSPHDEIVPYALGRKLYEAALAPKEFVDLTGTHNEGLFSSEDIFKDNLKRFLTGYHLL
ncbi:MAG TPA: alpha/beta hydrolase [Candidatus Omnitrophota bacterium]|nr:alpha/beta hydrolase [Candidatus Omnitrophota bacterium]